MARFHTLVGLGLASTMMITAPVFASTPAASTTTAAKPAAHTAATPAYRAATATAPKRIAATAAPKRIAATAAPKRVASTRTNTHLAKATLSNGKKVTYDCRLAGNKSKQACKG